MGGMGSGRPPNGPTLDASIPLDLPKLHRDGLLPPSRKVEGSLTWRSVSSGHKAASMNFTALADPERRTGFLQLDWRSCRYGEENWTNRSQHIALEALSQRFGGVSWYFTCPVSGRRCRKFYMPPGALHFAARQVWKLPYASQREAPYDRAISQAHKIRRRLGAPLGIGDWVDRPRGMHRATFERYVERLENYEAVVDQHLFAFVQRFESYRR